MEFTEEQIREQFGNLPPELKKSIANTDLKELTNTLRTKYSLHIDQIGRLATEITLVLVGLIPTQDFQSRLKRYIGVSDDVANLITYDINQQVFSKIQGELKKITAPDGSLPPIKREGEKEKENSPAISPEKQIFEQKMSGLANVPKQTIEVKEETGDNNIKATPPARDPYREPI